MESDPASQATATPETEAVPADTDAGTVRTTNPAPAGVTAEETRRPGITGADAAREPQLPGPRTEAPEARLDEPVLAPALFDTADTSADDTSSPDTSSPDTSASDEDAAGEPAAESAGTAGTAAADAPDDRSIGTGDAPSTIRAALLGAAPAVDAPDESRGTTPAAGTGGDSDTGVGASVRFARLRAYVRLAKLDILDYYLGLPVVWAMLRPGQRFDPRELAVLGLFLVGEVALVGALVAFDDVTGLRDGSDHANYGGDNPSRPLRRKPLIAGTLRESDAIRFGWLAIACGAAAWAGTVALAPHRPTWTLLAVGLCLVLGFQYSWWLSFSYHGLQELFLAALGWAYLLPPHGLASGTAGGFAVVQTLLFGLGPVLFGVYSNTNDIEGDRAVNRPTMATMTSPRGNTMFIAALSAVEAALIVGSAATGVAPWWFALALAPIIAARAAQFVVGMPLGRVLAARKLGIHIHRALVVALVVVDLCHGGVR